MTDSVVLVGHCLDRLRELPDRSVQACITSPPYWGLRDYGTEPQVWPDGWTGHLGLEPTPDLYIQHLVEVFREVRRVLRDDGTLWLNLGDSYARDARKGQHKPGDSGKEAYVYERGGGRASAGLDLRQHRDSEARGSSDGAVGRADRAPVRVGGLKEKDLIGIPWLAAFALRDDGWYLRQDIIWAKGVSGQKELTTIIREALTKAHLNADQITQTMARLEPYVGNCMPESVRDRCTQSFEHVFLLTKSAKYFYDGYAVMEGQQQPQMSRNRRSVWLIPTRPFKGSHFAVFPPHLVEPCLLASTPEFGSCASCGTPYRRVVRKRTFRDIAGTRDMAKTPLNVPRAGWRKGDQRFNLDDPIPLDAQRAACGADSTGEYHGTAQKDYATHRAQDPSATKARILAGMVEKESSWEPGCDCADARPSVQPALVLDPFGGSGTVAAVAELYGRRAISIELNPDYAALQELRRKDVRRALRRDSR